MIECSLFSILIWYCMGVIGSVFMFKSFELQHNHKLIPDKRDYIFGGLLAIAGFIQLAIGIVSFIISLFLNKYVWYPKK